LDLENEGIMILKNVGNHSPNDIASHTRRPEPSHVTVLETTEALVAVNMLKKLHLIGIMCHKLEYIPTKGMLSCKGI
jgi:hypothetical protein